MKLSATAATGAGERPNSRARRTKFGQLAGNRSWLVVRIIALGCSFGGGDGQGQAPELASARHTHAPCQGGLVSRAIFSLIKTRCAVGSTAIAFGLTVLTRKAIVGCASSWGSAATFARGRGGWLRGLVDDKLGLLDLGLGQGHGAYDDHQAR